MRWYVKLRGRSADLTRLAKTSHAGLSFSIETEDEQFLITSDRWEDMDTPEEVRRDASEVVALLGGSAGLRLGHRGAVEVDGIRSGRDGGTTYARFAMDAVIANESATVTGPGVPTADLAADAALRTTELALRDADVATVLRRLAREPNWVDAYAVVEIVEKDVQPKRLGELGWTSNGDLRRLHATANNQQEIGDEARHGHRRFARPTDPMTLAEADALARTIAIAWIESKLTP